MTSTRFLKMLCDKCEFCHIQKGYKGCPWRSISNDYCPEYEEIRDILKKHGENK